MTKNFCDLCGERALDHWSTLRVEFPNMQWRGAKSSPGSIACTDGNWTPFVEARINFDAHDMPRNTYAHNPDMCANCIADLLRKMANKLVPDETCPNCKKTDMQLTVFRQIHPLPHDQTELLHCNWCGTEREK